MIDAASTGWPNAAAPVRMIALEWNLPMLIEVLVELSQRYRWRPVYCVSEDALRKFAIFAGLPVRCS
jgi:hypothetical protein